MYYTIMPHELLFSEDEKKSVSKQAMIEIDGVPVVIEQETESDYRIIQVLSSNPQHFLQGKYQPGKKVVFQPLLQSTI